MIEIRNIQKTEEVTSEELENLSKVVLWLEENNIEFDLMPPKIDGILQPILKNMKRSLRNERF